MTRAPSCITRFRRQEHGAVALEFAIVGTLFIFLSLAIIDFARNFHTQHRMAHMADQLARAVYLNPAMTAEELAARLTALGGTEYTLTVETTAQNGVPVRLITVTEDQDYISPGLSDLSGKIRILRSVPVYRPYS